MNILLLDAYNLMYRARYSFRPGGKDSPHGVIYSFFRSLRPLIEKFSPDKVYFVLDGKPRDRLAAAPTYKGTREYNDDDNFSSQRHTIIAMMKEYFPAEVVKHDNYECDDLIANIIEKWHPHDDCTIISSDSDFIQLLGESRSIQLYNPVTKRYRRATHYDYVVWKSLRGDASDNIIGFRGIGPKKAEALTRDEKKLCEFLDRTESGHDKFNHNYFMVKFHDMSDELHEVQIWPAMFEESKIRDNFQRMGFYSIVNEKSWNKFRDTFAMIPFTSVND